MNESAENECGLRGRKRAATRAAITAAARTLTAERGLSGYTVEEVCEQTDISRRTFFNYFPTKEDAIIGHVDDEIPAGLIEAFIAGGSSSPAGQISATLLQDLVDMSLALSTDMVASDAEVRQLIAVIHKEPQLMLRIIGATAEREAEFVRVLAIRERVAADHPALQMAVVVLSTVARKSSATYFSDGNTRSHRDLFLENLNAVRNIFSQSLTLSARNEGTP
ncbi:TetR/AcrR family transcriptional regulator [Pseudarthrobacter sp. PS3-L1]|uniref:TetR/AcrR family transcriptional regulator n=1 Tax=Pseudarthrobacter sp. PS3-L1 TaxID=3046207 RepID=UPI0024BAF7AC|nr:TetR/AcrR family transcriptional regulator [Pseudarthrobacter sp. PS3-L1]MDJ0319626.1 TetR family transcriptional regulator [Pseudarthrobacter sp. PS3-L1]